jgi:2-polyprenyl-6-methoxyphenol hydroxylase-like FAD-dependent oxidoreductase
MSTDRPYGHAVVAGGSLAGLLAANTLAKYFSRVTLVERDVLPTKSGIQRRGVPQGRHLHVLLGNGRQTMEKLMPGLTDGLIANGAVATDLLGGIRYVLEGHRAKQVPIGLPSLLAGRSLIESQVRERVRAIENVTFLEGCEVTGLMLDGSTGRVVGVRRSPADGSDRPTPPMAADLVIDATGRGARGTAWLLDAGLALPDEDEANIRIVYTTRHFRRHEGDLGSDQAVLITPTADNPRGGAMNAQEDGTWIVTLFGYVGEEAPVDLDGFKEFAGSLATKDIYDALIHAEPVDDGALIRFPSSRRRHYEARGAIPEGYLVVGDALASFNPIYGQGMTMTAIESDILNACVGDRNGAPLSGGSGLARDFYARLTPMLDLGWATNAGGDLKYSGVGTRTPEVDQINAFMSQVYAAAAQDEEVSSTLIRLINLLEDPGTLQDPAFVERVRRAVAAQAG